MVSLVLALTFGTAPGMALAHGESRPQHGGLVREAGHLTFELVRGADGTATTTIYLADHDKPVDTSGMSGRLSILSGKERSEVDLRPAGGNRLQADIALPADARLIATIALDNGKTLSVRFVLR